MSRILSAAHAMQRPDSLQFVGLALELAAVAARADIELDCAEYHDSSGRWWNTCDTHYLGNAPDEVIGREAIAKAVAFLAAAGMLVQHAELPYLVRFPEFH
jgi:hypothetical protein